MEACREPSEAFAGHQLKAPEPQWARQTLNPQNTEKGRSLSEAAPVARALCRLLPVLASESRTMLDCALDMVLVASSKYVWDVAAGAVLLKEVKEKMEGDDDHGGDDGAVKHEC